MMHRIIGYTWHRFKSHKACTANQNISCCHGRNVPQLITSKSSCTIDLCQYIKLSQIYHTFDPDITQGVGLQRQGVEARGRSCLH